MSVISTTAKARKHRTDPFPILENDSCLVLVLKILRNSLAKVNGNAQLILGIVEDNRVQLASVAIENWRLWIGRGCELRVNKLSSPLVDFETVIFQIDAKRLQAICDSSV